MDIDKIELNVDSIIERLLQVRTNKPGKLVNLTETEILGIVRTVKSIFMSQPMLV